VTTVILNARGVRNGPRGFTVLELVLVFIVVGIAGIIAANRFLYYQELAEKATMDATLASFKMGLQIRSAELAISNNQSQAGGLERENPVRWLAEPPAHYAGEYPAHPQAGHWYFDAKDAALVYVPNNTRYLQLSATANSELRFRVKLKYDVVQTPAGGARMPAGISIVATPEYRWF
jgi:general secretion pathway protein G